MLRPRQALDFSITLYWNRNPISGSSFDWKTLGAFVGTRRILASYF
jgi:hypothetical protein